MKKVETKDLIAEFFKLEDNYWKLEAEYIKATECIDATQEKLLKTIIKRKDLTLKEKVKLRNAGVEI
jgi:hypothetical protein